MFYAAETSAPIPNAAMDRLQLPAGFSAREVIDWLAQGYGWRARSPQQGRYYGLFERLAGVMPRSRRKGQQLCPHCGTNSCMGTDDDSPSGMTCYLTDKPMPQSYLDALDRYIE